MEIAELKAALDEAGKITVKAATEASVKEIEAKGFCTKAEIDEIIKKEQDAYAEKVGGELDAKFKALKENAANQEMSIKAQINEFVAKNIDKIGELYKQKNGLIEIDLDLKAVGDITTSLGTIPVVAPTITAVQQAPLSNVNLRDAGLLTLANVQPTDMAAFPYTDAIPGAGVFLEVAESALKPGIDFTWSTRFATPFKVAAWERLTEEAVKDVKNLQAVATDYLFKQHNLKKQKAVLFGTGDGVTTIKGARSYATVYAGAGALAVSVKTPNLLDVINAMITTMYTTKNYVDESSYVPNVVLVNPIDFYKELVSAKNTQGNYLFPDAALMQQVRVGSVLIIPEIDVIVGEILCLDMSKYNITNYVGYTVRIGWVNDDFIKNQFVILGESRFHAFVKNLDQKAFLRGVISTIKTAITAP
jgi:HK97 family phage major capsid protein